MVHASYEVGNLSYMETCRSYRRCHNAEQTLEAFAEVARDAVELALVTEALLGAVEETL